ncbi:MULTISPECIES: hypothetical protein [unclassified Mesorhizobium]|uniref:hypothetical protein n=1 Tax=unclassified Mesorhizobium TaxID=325217 RepID=UPI000FC9A42E|nr:MULTISPECIES: hypothetical protein [unclassified Mesorhizobium]RUW26334.1 hypothetical protein EOA34_08615 [Mesorhizobium sp. M4B.F.Ca.ET.013.02.1.1]RVD21135.1 hypothetical protein EN738_19785 [Mesorhizobium sp. M4B.F.Ca.ET.017.02.2.1]
MTVIDLSSRRLPYKTHVAEMQFLQFQSIATGVEAHLKVLSDEAFAAEYRALNEMLSASPVGEAVLDVLAGIYVHERERRQIIIPAVGPTQERVC